MSKAELNGPRDVDAALDRVLGAMTAVDEAAARRGQARIVEALREGRQLDVPSRPGADERSRRGGRRPAWAGDLAWPGDVAWPGLAARAAVAALLVTLAGGALWWSARSTPSPPIDSASTRPPQEAPPPREARSRALPDVAGTAATPPVVDPRPPRLSARPLAESASRVTAGTAARLTRASRAGRGGAEGAARVERAAEQPIGDPVPALAAAALPFEPVAAPEAVSVAPLEQTAIPVEPIRLEAFDAPVSPRSH